MNVVLSDQEDFGGRSRILFSFPQLALLSCRLASRQAKTRELVSRANYFSEKGWPLAERSLFLSSEIASETFSDRFQAVEQGRLWDLTGSPLFLSHR